MTDTRLTLYVDAQFLSPYAMAAYVALKEKRLDFEWVMVDLARGEQRQGDLADLLPTGRVPCLLDQGFALAESTAIAEYLDERFPQTPLYPADLQSRARARQVQAWLRSDLLALRQERPTEVIFQGKRLGPLSEAGEAAAKRLISFALALVPGSEPFLFGQWSLADLDLAVMLNRLASHGDALPEVLRRYVAAQWHRPSVQAWVELGRNPPQAPRS
jgi:glutathione S-transferase